MLTYFNLMVLVLLPVVLVYVSYTDIKERRIPNTITHPCIVVLFVARLIWDGPIAFLGLLPALLFLILFFVNSNWIGAGDVKLLAVIGLCMPFDMISILFWMCISSLVFVRWIRQTSHTLPLAPFMAISVGLTFIGRLFAW